jgi:putative PIN family toxin of toxin-antitoxin system
VRAAEALQFRLFSSAHILTEVARALGEPKFAGRVGEDERRDYLTLLRSLSTMSRPRALLSRIATHPEDDWVLATAQAGKADFLVTGDKQLLALDGRHGLGAFRIVTPAEFLAVLEEQGTSRE